MCSAKANQLVMAGETAFRIWNDLSVLSKREKKVVNQSPSSVDELCPYATLIPDQILFRFRGVDFHWASLISSFIGGVNRFPPDDHLASFFGIVPTSRDSANVKRRGKMTKDGSMARTKQCDNDDDAHQHTGAFNTTSCAHF